MFPELLVLRHGETVWNVEERLQGQLDSPLTALGREQAAAQGRILAAFGVDGWDWKVSPQGRAVDTAKIASEGMDVRLAGDARLAEITMGDWAGRRREELQAEHPQLFDAPSDMLWYNHAPGGEGIDGVADRAASFLAALETPTVVVTHGITSRVLRSLATGREPGEFAQVGGGQGIVYHIANGVQTALAEGP